MQPLADLIEQSNQAGLEFLRTELDLALTFLSVASTTHKPENALRNRENARLAYASILRYQGRLHFQGAEKIAFGLRVAEVKLALVAAGIAVEG